MIAAEKAKFDLQYNKAYENRKNETEFTHMVDGLNRLWGYNDSSEMEDTCMFLPFMLFWEELVDIRKDADEFMITDTEFADSTRLKRKRN